MTPDSITSEDQQNVTDGKRGLFTLFLHDRNMRRATGRAAQAAALGLDKTAPDLFKQVMQPYPSGSASVKINQGLPLTAAIAALAALAVGAGYSLLQKSTPTPGATDTTPPAVVAPALPGTSPATPTTSSTVAPPTASPTPTTPTNQQAGTNPALPPPLEVKVEYWLEDQNGQPAPSTGGSSTIPLPPSK